MGRKRYRSVAIEKPARRGWLLRGLPCRYRWIVESTQDAIILCLAWPGSRRARTPFFALFAGYCRQRSEPAEACPALAAPIESDGFVCDLYRALAFSVGELSVGRAPAPGSAVPGRSTSRFRKRPSFVRSPQLSILDRKSTRLNSSH